MSFWVLRNRFLYFWPVMIKIMKTFDLVINNFTNGKCTIKFINLAIKCLLVQTHSKRSVILANCSVVYSSKPPQKLIYNLITNTSNLSFSSNILAHLNTSETHAFFLSFHFPFPTILNKENKELRSHRCHYLRKRASNAVFFFFLFEIIVWANKIPVTAKKSEWLRFPLGLILHLWIGFNGLTLIDKSAVFSVFWSLGRYSTPTCWPYVSGRVRHSR